MPCPANAFFSTPDPISRLLRPPYLWKSVPAAAGGPGPGPGRRRCLHVV